MSDGRVFRWASTSARLLVGSVVAIGAVVAVVTAVSLPWPTISREPVQIVTSPAPSATVLSCDGGILAVGRDVLEPGALEPAAAQTVTSGVGADSPAPASSILQGPDVLGGSGPESFVAEPFDGVSTDLAAAGSATVSDTDLAGFAASACRPPLMESWLVAGSAATGAADLVLLTNPGSVPATAQLTIYGADGPQTPPGSEFVIPAGTQKVVPIAGLARGEASPVIRVNATGAPIQASVQSSLTRVLEPGGVDQSGAVPASAAEQRIVGVAVTEDPGDAATQGAATVVRLLSPSADADGVVTVRPVGQPGGALSPTTVPLTAGIPTEVGLDGLAPGEYIVEVSATAPVVASVWQTTGFGEDADFAWHMPSPEVAAPTLFAVPAGPAASLTVLNPGAATASVALQTVAGEDRIEIDLAPGESAVLPVERREVYALDSGGAGVLAAITMVGDDAIAGFPVWPADAAAPAIRVFF